MTIIMKGRFCCSVFLLLVLATLYILTRNEMNLWQPTRTVRTEGKNCDIGQYVLVLATLLNFTKRNN